MIKKLINRLKNILSLGPDYYHGELYTLFDDIFIKLEKQIITPDEAKKKVNNLFHSNQNLRIQSRELSQSSKSSWIIIGNKPSLKIIGTKLGLYNKIRFGVIYVEDQGYEPLHYHDGFISFQIIIHGSCVLDECDKIEIKNNNIYYKKHKRIILNENDVMLNYSKYRDIHGFGSIKGPAYILSIGKYYGFLGKFKIFQKKLKTNDRFYIDSVNSNKVSESVFVSPLISEKDAYLKYSKLENFKF